MINKGGTAEHFGPLQGGIERLFFYYTGNSLPIIIVIEDSCTKLCIKERKGEEEYGKRKETRRGDHFHGR